MKKLLRTIFIILLAAGMVINAFSQQVTISDSTGVKSSSAAARPKNQDSNKPGNAHENQGIKKIKGARPDMSRAKGARPPEIVRPSGSRIPKGMGKPGGAVKRGGR